jgi:hypothetical protein
MGKAALTDNQKTFYDAVKKKINDSNHQIISESDLIDFLEENPPLFFLKKNQIYKYINFFILNENLYTVDHKKVSYISHKFNDKQIIQNFEKELKKKQEEKEINKTKQEKKQERYQIFKSLPDESQKKISKIINLERKIRRDIEMLEISKEYDSDKEILKIEKKIEENKVRLKKMIDSINLDEKNVLCLSFDQTQASLETYDRNLKNSSINFEDFNRMLIESLSKFSLNDTSKLK